MAWDDTSDSIVLSIPVLRVVARLHVEYEIKPLRDDLTLDLEGYME